MARKQTKATAHVPSSAGAVLPKINGTSAARRHGARDAVKPAATGAAVSCADSSQPASKKSWSQLFSDMACATAQFAGKPQAFIIATLAVVIWAVTGPLFGFSDTWQLVINTSTTIVTFLMVFLIQHTQNRDTLALQLKLAELIIALKGAENRIATAEDLSEEDLERLHEEYRHKADSTLEQLTARRGRVLKPTN